ncbi:pyruvate formate-lyase-activating protein [Fusobacterium sp. MFO224]|uniref:pyruvate formate-lyase-activating protein n=1 Tax=Fusobacterium sp. MFO224 TaxID=3378070 RepID=UPI003852DE1F
MLGNIHSYESFGTVDGPGIRYVVFLQGCPLRCKFCHNPDTWDIKGKNKLVSSKEVFDELIKYKNFFGKDGGLTVSGGEPLLQSDFVLELFKICKENNINTVLDTSGYIFNDKVKEILKYTDLVLLDIKCIDEKIYKELTGVDLKNTLDLLEYLKEIKKDVWVRHVIVPGITDDDVLLTRLAHYLEKFGNIKKIELLPYHTLGVFKYEKLKMSYPLLGTKPLSEERLLAAKKIFKQVK